ALLGLLETRYVKINGTSAANRDRRREAGATAQRDFRNAPRRYRDKVKMLYGKSDIDAAWKTLGISGDFDRPVKIEDFANNILHSKSRHASQEPEDKDQCNAKSRVYHQVSFPCRQHTEPLENAQC